MMIKLNLQMFGTGSLGAHKGGGGGRSMDKRDVKREQEMEQTVSTQSQQQRRQEEERRREPAQDYKTPVTRVAGNIEYTIHSLRGEKETLAYERVTGADIIRAQWRYDPRAGVWRDQRGKQYRIRIRRK